MKHVRTQEEWLGGESIEITGAVSGSTNTTLLLQRTILQSRNKLIHTKNPTRIKKTQLSKDLIFLFYESFIYV